MESTLRKIFENKADEDAHRYFVRFGKGEYRGRFLLSFRKSQKIKVYGSFEWANDFVKLANELKTLKFSGKILMKDKIAGKEGKKKAGVFVYEIESSLLSEYENAYHYLLDANDSEIVLKIKKALPKPGKSEAKIDDKFCSLELDLKYWQQVREAFFWDVPECKKVEISHTLQINEIVMPKGIDDPEEIRRLAKRKGKIIRKVNADGKEIVKEADLLV